MKFVAGLYDALDKSYICLLYTSGVVHGLADIEAVAVEVHLAGVAVGDGDVGGLGRAQQTGLQVIPVSYTHLFDRVFINVCRDLDNADFYACLVERGL